MPLQNVLPTTYRIEISGWDQTEDFFVEKADLEWSEEHGKKVFLRHQLRDGAVVFVRLIAPSAWGRGLPIVYEVQNLNLVDDAGRSEIRLIQLQPRS